MVRKLFLFLPTSNDCRYKTYVSKIQNAKLKLNKSSEYYNFQEAILNCVIDKVTPKDEMGGSWSKDNYLRFREYILTVKEKDIYFVENSLFHCFSLSKAELENQLKVLEDNVSWYPQTEISKSRRIEKPINHMDSYWAVIEVYKLMNSEISRVARTVINESCDKRYTYSMLEDICKDPKLVAECLEQFDEKFAFTRNLSIFSDLYEKVRSNYFVLFIRVLTKFNNDLLKKTVVDKSYVRTARFDTSISKTKRG